MSCSARWLGSREALLGATLIAGVFLSGQAQSQSNEDEGDSRGVRIIDAPAPPPGAGSASPVLTPPVIDIPGAPRLTPAAPSQAVAAPTLTPPMAAAPPALTPAPTLAPAPSLAPAPALTRPIIGEIPPATAPMPPAAELRPIPQVPALSPPAAPTLTAPSSAAPSLQPGYQPVPPSGSAPALNNLADLPKEPDGGVRPSPADIEALSSGLKIPNPAGLAMQILPGSDIPIGSQVSFQISSKKAGYLILVDVEATGKLVQIYPNPMSLMVPGRVRENSNFLRPGKPFRIPDRENLYSGYEFIASPPSGTAMVVAILSDRPVQMVDLPDVPISLAGSASAVEYVTKLANGLRIPDASGNGRLEEAHWSFDARFYAIR